MKKINLLKFYKLLSNYLKYPLNIEGLCPVIFSTIILSLFYLLMLFCSFIISQYAAILPLILIIALFGFAFGYFQEIIRKSYIGEDKPPIWEVKSITFYEWVKGVSPIIITIFESFLIYILLVYLFIIIFKKPFIEMFFVKGKFLFICIFVLLQPINLLSYSLYENLNILDVLFSLTKKGAILLLTIFPLFFFIVMLILIIPISIVFLNLILKWFFIFYLLEVISYSLGRLFFYHSS